MKFIMMRLGKMNFPYREKNLTFLLIKKFPP